ncbi:hypothetical protein TSL6_02080 [Sulfurovum sp. TSL6]|uniref:stress protein, tellurium resistance protein TerZ n=1 Tax=Sulfurovum sp. TSL6 TaxID=2826995 RepID=UPI001CC408CA|nr:stress protein, tellurium resistance protein TerZ [Sulfurovum sp. TSL6]GIT99701.1 hypothetical protein TSL6_02080 [Sulfurovum sp. TSL6]
MRQIKIIYVTLLSIFILCAQNAIAKEYEVPPTSSTRGHVPYISDQAMEVCIKLYNEAKWLDKEISNTQVNQYSQASVDAYNNKVSHHSQMINDFNRNCAGKQSESAYKAAQKLNNK